MNYLYESVQNADFEANTNLRIAFKAHLVLVAKALRAIEWHDSGDSGPEAEELAIKLVFASRP